MPNSVNNYGQIAHDHIIRDHESYIKIYHYIQTNPQRWDQDKFN
ncbi:MAG TPA: hypothetical protein VHO90_18900 [Bacteroidales bacterium]|nr:hypothetical protein [Bacteroidales bacterium]